MKYIITDKGEVRTGGVLHQDMGKQCVGVVVRAGHYQKNEDGTYRVWGESIEYNIKSNPEDARFLEYAEFKRV